MARTAKDVRALVPASDVFAGLPSADDALLYLDKLRREIKTAPFEFVNDAADFASRWQRVFGKTTKVGLKAGRVWVAAETRVGKERRKLAVNRGTRGLIAARDEGGKIKPGGSGREPPGNAPSLLQLGLAKKRSARAVKLAAMPDKEQ